MAYVILPIVALVAAALTFFSGFGLGTLLMPAFALFMPIEQAIALTAVVHFLNGLLKLILVGRHVDRSVLVQFGVPAMAAALLGAWLLSKLTSLPVLYEYSLRGHVFQITPVKLVIGTLLLLFTLLEALPWLGKLTITKRHLVLGGLLSGFFGGLSGHQGALRSAFLVKLGLSKEAFIATGVAIACLIDVTRIGFYAQDILKARGEIDWNLLAIAVAAAFAGTFLGNQFLKKVTMAGVQRIVAVSLVLFGLALMLGVI